MCLELEIPTVYAHLSGYRARAQRKFRSLKTVMQALATSKHTTLKTTWVVGTNRALVGVRPEPKPLGLYSLYKSII